MITLAITFQLRRSFDRTSIEISVWLHQFLANFQEHQIFKNFGQRTRSVRTKNFSSTFLLAGSLNPILTQPVFLTKWSCETSSQKVIVIAQLQQNQLPLPTRHLRCWCLGGDACITNISQIAATEQCKQNQGRMQHADPYIDSSSTNQYNISKLLQQYVERQDCCIYWLQ